MTLTTDYLPDHEVLTQLHAADVLVFPYQHTQELASAAVRLGLASLVPVACTPLPIFDDVSNATYRLSDITPDAIADGINTLLSNAGLRSELATKQKAWLAAHAWPTLSRRLMGLIRGEFVDHCCVTAQAVEAISEEFAYLTVMAITGTIQAWRKRTVRATRAPSTQHPRILATTS